jgi:hypothetical protein
VEKALRIVSLQPHVSNGKIRLHRSQSTLIEQLKFWPEADHDDGPDALEKLWRIACRYSADWSYTPAGNRRDQRYAPRDNFDDWNDDD